MRIFLNILQYVAIVFAIYLSYHFFQDILNSQKKIIDLVGDAGTILICLDLTVFVWHNNRLQKLMIQDPSAPINPTPTFVKVMRKIGHFGILLILTSWFVPIING